MSAPEKQQAINNAYNKQYGLLSGKGSAPQTIPVKQQSGGGKITLADMAQNAEAVEGGTFLNKGSNSVGPLATTSGGSAQQNLYSSILSGQNSAGLNVATQKLQVVNLIRLMILLQRLVQTQLRCIHLVEMRWQSVP